MDKGTKMRVFCTIQGYIYLSLGMTVAIYGCVQDNALLTMTGVIVSGIGLILWRLGK